MAVRRCRWAVAIILVVELIGVGPAAAQGFSQNVFGWGAPSALSRSPAAPGSPAVQSPYSYRLPLFDPHRSDRDFEDPLRDVGGVYRTLCVRTCDGYYWPISQTTGRDGLARDSATCRSSCGQEARLYYQGSKSNDATEMIDLQGRPYSSLPTAFRYRKKLVEGCRCRPEPWSASERDRHRRYAQDLSTSERTEAGTVAFSGPPVPLLPSDARASAERARSSSGAGARTDDDDRLSSHRASGHHPADGALSARVLPRVGEPALVPIVAKSSTSRVPGSIKAPRPVPVAPSGPLPSKTWANG